MSKFIEVHCIGDEDDKTLFLNIEYIVGFGEDEDGRTSIRIVQGDCIVVKETVKALAGLIYLARTGE